MDRGLLDRLLLHTGTLASLYGKEPQTFIRGAKPKFLHDSPALDPEAKKSYLDSVNYPTVRPAHSPSQNPSLVAPSPSLGNNNLSPPAPLVPPKPRQVSVDDYDQTGGGGYEDGAGLSPAGRGGLLGPDDEEFEEEDEDAALNPSSVTNRQGGGQDVDDPLDPYASLARLSIDGFGSGLGASSDGYGYDAQVPLSGRGAVVHSLL